MFKPLNDRVLISPQMVPEAVAAAVAQGVVLLINNRPDGEEPDQPDSATMEAAARAQGLDYMHLPVRGLPDEATVSAFADALASAEGPVLAYCRSGMRSTVVWALSESGRGVDAKTIRQAAWQAGYDLSGLPL